MGIYKVTVAITTKEEIEIYAPNQEMAIDRVMENVEARPCVKKVKFIDVDYTDVHAQEKYSVEQKICFGWMTFNGLSLRNIFRKSDAEPNEKMTDASSTG